MRIQERIPKRRWRLRVMPHELACFVRLGRVRKVKGPGLRLSIPSLDRIHLLSVQPHSDVVTIKPLTGDGLELTMEISILYRLQDASRYISSRPIEDPATQHAMILEAKASEVISHYSPYNTIPGNRGRIAQELKESFIPHASSWGIAVDHITINHITLPDGLPKSAAEREEATIQIDTKRARGIGAGEEYRATSMAKLDVRERELELIGAFANRLSQDMDLESAEIRDVLFLLLRERMDEEDPVHKKITRKLEAEGISEGAEAAARRIKADSRYTFLLEELRETKGRPIIDLGSPLLRSKSPAELDRFLADAIWRAEAEKEDSEDPADSA